MKDITLGQYYPSDSIIHRLDPRIKLLCTILYIILIFSANNIFSFGLMVLGLLLVIKVSKVPFKYIVKGLKAIVFILIFTSILNIFMTPGTEIFRFHFIKITKEGIFTCIKVSFRLIFLIMGTSLMTLTTTPKDLTDGLEKSLGFLKKIKVPVHEISMMVLIALRFIPILVEETDKIMKAQEARGASFKEGNLLKKAKSLIPILVPLFISAFRRATDLAMALEARCYRGDEGRTKMKPLKYQKCDYMAYLIILLWIIIFIVSNILLKGIITL